jgi:serine/threonine protein kinase
MSTSSNFQELSASNNYPQPLDTLPSFWRSGNFSQSATSAQTNSLDSHHDFISFLAIAQRLKIDFLPITWQPALDRVGEGRTAEICQSLINLQTSFAFKRFKWSLDESSNFRALISEISVLGNSLTRNHPNIIRLEGICWDIPPGDVKVHPVLVFEKTQYGDLEQFVDSATGSKMELQDRLKLCVDIGAAILAMHSNRKLSTALLVGYRKTDYCIDIIHGDIKPQNVLVFNEEPNKFVARVADFGYSTQFATDNPLYMPKSWPWNAPEHHHRGFKPSEAVKMDIYSFGMLCLWFLFKERLSETIPPEILGDRRGAAFFAPPFGRHQSQNLLADLKSEDMLPTLASYLITTTTELNDEEKGILHELFNSSLVCDPDERSSDLEHLLHLLSPRVAIPRNAQLTKYETPLLHEDFQVMSINFLPGSKQTLWI